MLLKTSLCRCSVKVLNSDLMCAQWKILKPPISNVTATKTESTNLLSRLPSVAFVGGDQDAGGTKL